MIFTSGLNGRLFLHRLCSCAFSPQEHIARSVFASSLLMCIFATGAYRRFFASSLLLCSSNIRNGKRGSSIEHKWPQWPFVFCIVFVHACLCHRNTSSAFASSSLLCSRNIRNGKNSSGIEQQQQQSAAVAAATTAVTAAKIAASHDEDGDDAIPATKRSHRMMQFRPLSAATGRRCKPSCYHQHGTSVHTIRTYVMALRGAERAPLHGMTTIKCRPLQGKVT